MGNQRALLPPPDFPATDPFGVDPDLIDHRELPSIPDSRVVEEKIKAIGFALTVVIAGGMLTGTAAWCLCALLLHWAGLR